MRQAEKGEDYLQLLRGFLQSWRLEIQYTHSGWWSWKAPEPATFSAMSGADPNTSRYGLGSRPDGGVDATNATNATLKQRRRIPAHQWALATVVGDAYPHLRASFKFCGPKEKEKMGLKNFHDSPLTASVPPSPSTAPPISAVFTTSENSTTGRVGIGLLTEDRDSDGDLDDDEARDMMNGGAMATMTPAQLATSTMPVRPVCRDNEMGGIPGLILLGAVGEAIGLGSHFTKDSLDYQQPVVLSGDVGTQRWDGMTTTGKWVSGSGAGEACVPGAYVRREGGCEHGCGCGGERGQSVSEGDGFALPGGTREGGR
ncbi:hypothetical protein FA13DRAFT_1704283 [Coprinellus micaceus]|uniref:Uncharacterized protein n=1 Tax=Coprinellus micaceus TaxID=71717 RepID=A0A4Y7U1C2_COPMI|nr:hypothetical protein FA13DRAFT_1704283 [Coprinellus micaceus]